MPSYQSQSRSPAIHNTTTPIPPSFGSRTPTFQPPSFYAAAAGLPYQTSSRQRCRSGDEPHNRNDSGVPLSYPIQHPVIDRDNMPGGDVPTRRANGSNQARSPSLSRPLERSKNGRDGVDKGTRREREDGVRSSQLMDLPLLETQLLPSLRDTINRMTHPPKPKSKAETEEPFFSRSRQRESSSSRPTTLYVSEQQSRSPGPSNSSATRSPYVGAAGLPQYQSFQQADVGPMTPRIPASSNHATSAPASSPNVVTKSSLQASRIKADTISPTDASITQSVRYTFAYERDLEGGGSVSVHPALQTDYTRSERQTKKPESSSDTRNALHATMESSYQNHGRSTPKSPRYASKSPKISPNIISPLAVHHGRSSPRSGIPQPKYVANTTTDSDLAQDYGRHLTVGRLVVTNGVAAPSSSDDENPDYEPAAMHHEYSNRNIDIYGPSRVNSRLPYLQGARFNSRPPAGQVGLGLGLTPTSHVEEYLSSEVSDDGRSTDGENGGYGWQDDIEQMREIRHDPPRGVRDSNSERRRQDALAGIVSGLHTQFGWHQAESGKSRLSQGESEYNTSGVGLAIGDTRDLHGNGTRTSAGFSRDPRRSPYQMHNVGDKEVFRYGRNEATHESRSSRFRDQAPDASQRSRKSNRRSMSQPPAMMSGGRSAPQSLHTGETPNQESSRKRQRANTSASKPHDLRPENETTRERDFRNAKRPVAQEGEHHRRTPRTAINDAVSQEREGFGIPTSLSFRGSDGQRGAETGGSRYLRSTNGLPHAESDLSTLGANGWEEQPGGPTDQLSNGAEALFRELTGKPDVAEGGSRKHRRRGMTVGHPPSALSGQTPRQPEIHVDHARHSRSLSVSSAPSIYEDQATPPQDDFLDEPEYGEVEGWRSTMSEYAYKDLLAKHGPDEMRRQNAIFELFASEDTFSAQLRMILRQFIRPLRRKDSKQWIPGVPAPVTRLFDWFNDIINLHLGMAIAMKTARRTWREGDIITKLTDIFVGFTPRLEIYQPYLVKVRSVTGIISQCVSVGGNDFGEFIKIREQDPECGGWSLGQLLLEPVKHLATYPESFLRILQNTPSTHPDYLPMLSLYHSSKMMMRIMDEVRKREEAYDALKRTMHEIEGLPPSVHLASRQRRLLWQGALSLTRIEGTRGVTRPPPRSSRKGQSNDGESGDRLAPPKIVIGYAPNDDNKRPAGRVTTQQRTVQPEVTIQAQVYILNDIMLLASPMKKSRRTEGKSWRLLEEIGVAKLLGLVEDSSGADTADVMIDLLPIPLQELEDGESLVVTRIRVALSPDDRRREVVDAMQRCYGDALRSLSFPSNSGQHLRLGLDDLEADTQQSVAAITSAGLPMPKSPSMQTQELREGIAGDSIDQEREERGWWTLRFQQVLGEMRRQDPLISLDRGAPVTR